MFAGDIPRRDEPLPRFIDDAAAAKLLRSAREHPDPFTPWRSSSSPARGCAGASSST
jgi:hypothetical protein